MSAIILVPPAVVPLANALAEGMGWGPSNFSGGLSFADSSGDVVYVGLHLDGRSFEGFAAALAQNPEAAASLTGLRIEPAHAGEFGPTHVQGLCEREGWTVTTWTPEPNPEIL